ncbi:MAG TPA: DUF4832 domain-containing protein [Terriglobia bacterium]|nr:DUF4832 domain-containing protein [Terriglobia bacterium]
MKSQWMLPSLVALAAFSAASVITAQNRTGRETVVVRPLEIHDVLVNPGMGITTFQRFNGDPINPGLGWSEEGPTAKLAAGTKPDFPDTSISYCRWFWETLEPRHGEVHWEIVDRALDAAREHHQTLAIRLMPYDQKHPLPQWYQDSGARRANKSTDKDGAIWQPDFSDPLYLKDWGEVVAAAGARYDGNPYLDSVDISSVGYWGEGWSDYMPAFEYQKALIDIWLDAFKRTPLLMNFDQPEALSYGTAHGAGWRLDCWGDMRSNPVNGTQAWSHMLDFYPLQIVRAGIQDVWQRSPVSLESCGVPGSWFKQGWDIDYILAQALRWHVTSVNIKSSAIPPAWKEKFTEFEKQMGYRFILRRFEYPKTVRAGSMIPVHMWWLNAGVAPVYREYPLAVELHSSVQGSQGEESSAIIHVPVDVRKWLPGDAVYDGTLYVPDALKPGAYTVRIAMLDPRTGDPAIKLAIQGRAPDGWYDLGMIQVGSRDGE